MIRNSARGNAARVCCSHEFVDILRLHLGELVIAIWPARSKHYRTLERSGKDGLARIVRVLRLHSWAVDQQTFHPFE